MDSIVTIKMKRKQKEYFKKIANQYGLVSLGDTEGDVLFKMAEKFNKIQTQ